MEEIGINSLVLKDIVSGKKTVETRLGKERFLNFNPGDTISIREDFWEGKEIVRSIPRAATIIVREARRFDSFRTMFNHIDFKKVIPGAKNTEEALRAYELYYDKADEQKYGVVAISFEVV